MERRAPPLTASAEEASDSSVVTVAAGDTPASASRPAPPILALSEDPVLLEAMAAAALDQAPVIVSPSQDRFIDQLVASGAELALIDAAAVPGDVSEFLDSVHRQFPQLQLLLAGPGNVQHQLGAQMSDGTVFRFVHKPASAQRLRLFVDAAVRERQTRLTEQILSTPSPNAAAVARVGGKSDRPWLLSLAVAVLLVIAAAGAVIWYASRSEHAGAPAQSAQKSEAAAPVATPVPSIPAASPRSTNPGGATEAEQEAIDRAAAERSERSEKERLAAEAEARQASLAEQTRHAASDARAAQIHQLVAQARIRIASGALIEPANDSARTYVSAALEQAPDDQEVRAVSIALGEALVSSFRQALTAGEVATASEWLKAARAHRIAQPTLAQMTVQLDTYQAAQLAQAGAAQAVETVSSMVPPPAASAPAEPQAAAPQIAGTKPVEASDGIVQEGALHRILFNPPKYPLEALVLEVKGIVEMDFTLTPAGTVADIKITKTAPIGVFEQAARSALARNRYEPVQRGGVPVAQRVHIRMRFAL
jgi:TonB family protein